MRTRRLVSLMIAVVAAIIWVLSTQAAADTWDSANVVLRLVAGTVTVAAAAEWLVLSIRESRQSVAEPEVPAADAPDESQEMAAGPAEPAAESLTIVPEPDEPPAGAPGESREPVPDPAQPRGRGRRRAARAAESPADRASLRSGGFRTLLDTVRPLFGRRRTADENLAIVAGGGAVLVVAYLMERKVRRISLRVGLDRTSVESLEAALGAAPHRVFGTQAPARGLFDRSAYTQVEGASGSGAWSVSVPTEHVEVVRYVLARAEEIR